MRRSDRAASLLSRKAQRTLEIPEVDKFAAWDLLLPKELPRSHQAAALPLAARTDGAARIDGSPHARLATGSAPDARTPFELGELR